MATKPLHTQQIGHQTSVLRCLCLFLSWGIPWIPTGAKATLGLLGWDLSAQFKDARERVRAQQVGVAGPSRCSMPGREGVLGPGAPCVSSPRTHRAVLGAGARFCWSLS